VRVRQSHSIDQGSASAFRVLGARANARAVAAPSVLRCMVTIFALKLAVKWFGLWRTLCWIGRDTAEGAACLNDQAARTKATELVVATAAAFYPGRALCLEQSLTLYYILRRQGIPVTYCQGVQSQPFQAHAWIEYDGEPLNDMPERVRRFARLHR
jgi:transglutaminase superfamily protein